MISQLLVRFGTRVVGRLDSDAPDRFGFEYDSSWLSYDHAFPVSVSLPLRKERHAGGPAHWYFANLLPEGEARVAVCERLGLSVGNDWGLLRAIGGECAGALSIVELDAPQYDTDSNSYEELDQRRLQTLVGRDVAPLLIGGSTARLSLAGAQDKLPVAVLGGELHLCLGGAPSTHILKLPHPRFAHIPLNEAYVMGLAQRLGFDVSTIDLVTKTDPPSLLVERYDRRASVTEWPVIRLHQEDFCQALALSPSQKYEQEGGPSLASCIALVSSNVQRPLEDTLRLVEWQAFNVVVGNCDGHGKNLSFLYEGCLLRLAPFYDLLSTRQYTALDRRLAMSVGGRRDPAELHRAQWQTFAKEAKVGSRIVLDAVHSIAERCLNEIPAWTKAYRERFGRRAILQTLPAWIVRNARRVQRQLAA